MALGDGTAVLILGNGNDVLIEIHFNTIGLHQLIDIRHHLAIPHISFFP